ncbi:hypothetical protein HU200_011632 [Digitaria exilis]|uniref:AMP-dependent synthetase/ligase domain-containing protein n=1 Tax=Digitaria exilis TaxID=1010633 RepID=A0A835FGV2_9POAL|nr:hypothetical protein HU200_011632 [Digitaria exilis]
MNPYFVGLLVPVAFSLLIHKRRKAERKRGVRVEVGGEPGYAVRNYRFEQPVETHWEGVFTLAELFEQSCKQYVYLPLLGTRSLISRETESAPGGRSFEKLHLGEYEWKCYAEAFKSVCDFSSGLIRLGHQKNERVAIFAETRAEWQHYGASQKGLKDMRLCIWLAITEVTTVICGHKELKKLIDISGQLDTVKRVVYINEEGISDEVSLARNSTSWVIEAFDEVGDASALKPTLMTAVPAILDRVRDGVRKKVMLRVVCKKVIRHGYNRRLAAINGSWLGAWGLEKLLWDTLFSERAPIGQGYGLTETCAGGTFSEYDDTSVGRVGAPLPCSYIKQGIKYSDFTDLCQKQEAVKEVLGSLAKAAKQARLEKFEIPAKIKLIPEPWTPESGLVTAALKLKREVIRKTYENDLAQLYA